MTMPYSALADLAWPDAGVALAALTSVTGHQLDDGTTARFLALSPPERRLATERAWAAVRYFSKQLTGREGAALLQVSYPYFQVLAYRWRDSHDPASLVAFKRARTRTSRTPDKQALIDTAFEAVVRSGTVIKPATVLQAMAQLDPLLSAKVSQAYVTQRFGKLILRAPSGIPFLPRRYWSASTPQRFASILVIDQVKIDRWLADDNDELHQLRINLIIDAHTRLILAGHTAIGEPSPDAFRAIMCSLPSAEAFYGPSECESSDVVFQLSAAPGWDVFANWIRRAGFESSSRRIAGLNSGALARRLLGEHIAVLKTGRRAPTGKQVRWTGKDIETQLTTIIQAHNTERLKHHPAVSCDHKHASGIPYSLAHQLFC